MKSYSSNRKQFVSRNGENSTQTNIKYGDPQGSIMGPLFFLLYVNNIPNIYKLAKFILYAEIANITITGNYHIEVWEHLNQLNKYLIQWVNYNDLAINFKKTKFMILLFSRNRNINFNLNVTINKVVIERKTEARFYCEQ